MQEFRGARIKKQQRKCASITLFQKIETLSIIRLFYTVSTCMLEVINAILPVFLLIFIGWFTLHKGIITQAGTSACKTLVTSYVFPALLFMETAYTDPKKIIELKWLGAFLLAMFLIWLICFCTNKVGFSKSVKSSSLLSLLCTFPNMGGMGIPFLLHMIGNTALISVVRANFVVALTLIPLTIVLLELQTKNNVSLLRKIYQAIWRSIKKPLFLSVFIGLIFNLTGITKMIPHAISETLHITAQACVFISLFTVGAALHGKKIILNKIFIFNMSMKCIGSALIALAIVLIFHIHGNDAREFILLLAMPTATVATIMALQWNTETEAAISIYLGSTVCSLLTLPILLYVLLLIPL